MPPTNYNSNKLNLKDCLKDNENEEILSGENKIYCINCNKYSDVRTKNEIYKAPKVLILIQIEVKELVLNVM